MANSQAEIYTIFCLVLGEDTPFSIEIAKNRTVDILKKMIKEEKRAFSQQDADSLKLYLVEIADEDDLEKKADQKMLEGPPELRATKKLMDVFNDVPKSNAIHIIVQRPGGLKRKHSTSDSDNRKVKRMQTIPPSSATEKLVTTTYGKDIVRNRPVAERETIPIALLHAAFGNFLDDCQNYVPTRAENRWLSDLRPMMLKAYPTEADRAAAFRIVFEDHGIKLAAATVGNHSYITDGHYDIDQYFVLISEAKNEWTNNNADAMLQAFLYYMYSVDFLHTLPNRTIAKRLPCLIVYYVGSVIGFAGAIYTDKPMLEPLTPLFPLQTNAHNGAGLKPIARSLGALRLALESLKSYYTSLKTMASSHKAFTTNPEFPYRDFYMAADDEDAFEYVERIDPTKLLFLAERRRDKTQLCIKFTQKYSKDAHQFCAAHSVAPQLYAVEKLPGGWLMVVMEYLETDAYTVLSRPTQALMQRGVTDAVALLHRGGFVHGDIRDVNVMLRVDWNEAENEKNVKLVDFDWAGPDGQTYYPPNVNYLEIKRPEGVTDGVAITKAHDVAMLGYMFGQ